jgi:pyrophosphatase PpaX
LSIKNIIFDWDGTLLKTLELWLESYQVAFNKRDLQFGPAEIVAEFFQDHHRVPERHPDLDFPTIAKECFEYVHKAVSSATLYDGAVETLSALKSEQTTFSLVSSSSRKVLEAGLGSHGFKEDFVSIIAGDDGFGYKPSASPFEEMLTRMGVNAAETLVIGDSHVDILAGKAVGCQTCLFLPPENALFHDVAHLKSHNADFEISHMPDLLKLL